MRRKLLILLALPLLFAPRANAQQSHGVLGLWREPGGSVINIAPCAPQDSKTLCATLFAIRPNAPSRFDIHNPDAALRSHPLCGLVVGRNFHLTTPDHAQEGTLYDPKNGKTYRGEMTASAAQLALRGYVGIPLFGRTETWTRTTAPTACKAQ